MTAGAQERAERRRRLRRDAERLRRFQRSKFGYAPVAWFLDPAWIAVLLHRLSREAWARGRRRRGRLLMQLNSVLTGADIHPDSDLGPGLLLPSPCGATLSGRAGRDFTAMALTGLGGSEQGADRGAGPGLPVLGDRVTAGPFAGVQGGLVMGDGVFVQAGAGAQKDVAAGSTMALAAQPEALAASAPAPAARAPHAPCPHADWSRGREDFRADLDRYLEELARYGGGGRAGRLSARLSNPLIALWIHRRSHWHYANGRRRSGLRLARLNLLLFKLTVPPGTCLGGGALVPHLAGAVLCGRAGRRLTLYANGLCAPHGDAFAAAPSEGPWLGDEVVIGGHAGVFGPVRVGRNVRLAAKVQVCVDVSDDTRVFSPMARFVETPAGEVRPPAAGDESPPPISVSWAETRRRMARDRERLIEVAGEAAFPALACTRLHRLSHHFYSTGRLRRARWCWLAKVYLTGADISPASEIGPGLVVPQPAGIAVHGRAGADLTLGACSGIGPGRDDDGRLPGLERSPRLGDGVRLAPHSGVHGAIEVGMGVRTGPGCILTRSVPAGAVMAGRPLKLRRARSGPIDTVRPE
jgi:serine acetyltransferase